jgi:hypothetical protein
MMTVERMHIGWRFWLQWVLASTVDWFVGFYVGFVSGTMFLVSTAKSVPGDILVYFILGAALGSGVGLVQWLVLRRRISRAGWWVLASTAGFAVAVAGGSGAAVVAFGYDMGGVMSGFMPVLGWTVVAALGGAVTGTLQRLVLRGQVSRAGWWVLASTVGWGLSMAVMARGFGVMGVGGLFWPLAGAGLGAVTGGALVWLLRQPAKVLA